MVRLELESMMEIDAAFMYHRDARLLLKARRSKSTVNEIRFGGTWISMVDEGVGRAG